MKLAIYGSCGLGQEVFLMAKRINEQDQKWDEIVFIDDFETLTKKLNCNVYNFDDFCANYTCGECEVVIAVGEPAAREMLFNKVKAKGYNLATLIHPCNNVNLINSRLGEGVVICFSVSITSNTVIGDNTCIQNHADIGHDSIVGKHCVIGDHGFLGGHSKYGDRIFTGFNSGSRENISIGSDSIIAAGAVVMKIFF